MFEKGAAGGSSVIAAAPAPALSGSTSVKTANASQRPASVVSATFPGPVVGSGAVGAVGAVVPATVSVASAPAIGVPNVGVAPSPAVVKAPPVIVVPSVAVTPSAVSAVPVTPQSAGGKLSVREILSLAQLDMYADELASLNDVSKLMDSDVVARMKPFHRKKLERIVTQLKETHPHSF